MVKNLPTNAGDKVQSMGQEDPLEKKMATHSNILAWRIPQTEELDGLQSTGCKESDTTERSSSFPYFLQFKSEFGNKVFMILATVSSQSYFC